MFGRASPEEKITLKRMREQVIIIINVSNINIKITINHTIIPIVIIHQKLIVRKRRLKKQQSILALTALVVFKSTSL